MHIVIASWFYEGQPGYLDFKYRIRALAERYSVTLLLRHAFFTQEFADLPLRIEVIGTNGTGAGAQLWFMKRCADFCRRERPGLVVLLGSQLAMTTYLLRGAPVLLYWNEHPTHFFYPDFRNPLKRLVYRGLLKLNYAAAKRADTVMPIGEAHQEDLRQHGVDPARTELIHMGVEDRFGFIAQINQAPPLRLIYTGTVMRERGRDVMLDALALLRGRGLDVTLTIVGASDEQLEYCQARAAELGIEAALTLVGRVPGARIPAYLAAADLGICIWEDRIWWRYNPPTKLFEYLVAGLPVLGSRIRSHTDYIVPDLNGWIFDYDAASLAACVAGVFERRAHLPAVSQAAHASGEKYLWSAIEPQFLALVRRTLNASSASSF